MNVRNATICVTVGCGIATGLLMPLEAWPGSAKSLTTVLAIFAAGLLVRLNRGLPTIDWSKVPAAKRADLVGRMKRLSIGYGITLAQIGVVMIGLLIAERATFPILGDFDFYSVPEWVRRIASGGAGAAIAFVAARVAYVVWRDIDIVEFQAEVITEAASTEVQGEQVRKAEAVRRAGVVDPRKQNKGP